MEKEGSCAVCLAGARSAKACSYSFSNPPRSSFSASPSFLPCKDLCIRVGPELWCAWGLPVGRGDHSRGKRDDKGWGLC